MSNAQDQTRYGKTRGMAGDAALPSAKRLIFLDETGIITNMVRR